MASVHVSPMPGVRALRLVRKIAVRSAGRGAELLASILDVEPSRLRAELVAIRPAYRWLLATLVASIVCSIFVTVAAILYLTETAAAPTEQAVVQLAAASIEGYDTILKRPLFYRSRQPSTMPAERAILPAPSDPQVTLRGIFINGDLAKAFIVSGENPRGVWRKRGEDVAGWRVADIFSNRIVLESRTQQLVVPLSYANGR